MRDKIVMCMLSRFRRVWFFVTLWTAARQAPLSMGFSRQKYWSGLPFPPLGDLADPGMDPMSLMPHALAVATKSAAAAAKSFQSCPTLCNPIDSSPLGSSVPGGTWVSIFFLWCSYFLVNVLGNRKIPGHPSVLQTVLFHLLPDQRCIWDGYLLHAIHGLPQQWSLLEKQLSLLLNQ